MLAEQLGETAELQDREVELLQRRLQRLRLLGEQVVDRRHRVLQGQEQLLRWLVVGLVVVRLGLAQFVPGTLDTLQRFPQDLRGGLAHTEEIALVEFGGIHPPAALHQVVRLVHQYRHPPLVDLGQAMEHGAEVEVVVVVAHRQVAPARQFLAQVVDPVRQRHLAQPRLVQPARLHGGCAGRRQAFVKPWARDRTRRGRPCPDARRPCPAPPVPTPAPAVRRFPLPGCAGHAARGPGPGSWRPGRTAGAARASP